MKIKVGLVDDHQLFIKSLALMVNSFKGFTVIVDALHGKALQEKLVTLSELPDIMLIDVSMPVMDGIETAKWLSQHYPTIRLVALSMNDKDQPIIDMLKAGCTAYLFKDTHPDDLEKALTEVYERGYYHAEGSTINYAKLLNQSKDTLVLTEKEKEFLVHACSDLTYKKIASIMGMSERTIDGYRESLFHKLHVQSRTGMALEAIRRGLVKL